MVKVWATHKEKGKKKKQVEEDRDDTYIGVTMNRMHEHVEGNCFLLTIFSDISFTYNCRYFFSYCLLLLYCYSYFNKKSLKIPKV